MLVSDYNYDLPEERIAKFPPGKRGTTRLLVLDRKTGDIKDSYYRDLADFLNPGDVLVLNDTRVMKSRLFCELPDGRKRELVVLEKHGDEPQRVMYRGKLHEGDKLIIHSQASEKCTFEEHIWRRAKYGATEARDDGPEGAFRESTFSEAEIVITKILGNGIAEVESEIPLAELAETSGSVPLPPYLHRDATEEDKARYQTVFAKEMGSAAAPTASLNMTDELLEKLRRKGVIIKYLTLHVGLGTFLPIRCDKIEDHKMHSEWFHIPEDTIEALRSIMEGRVLSEPIFSDVGLEFSSTSYTGEPGEPPLRGEPLGRVRNIGVENSNHSKHPKKQVSATHPRIIALGTTVARTLEYYAKTGKASGEDDIFIYPGFEFKIVDALLTNFHAPKSTVLMLASAFAGWDHLKNAYEHAIAEKYNFLSYGDSMFIY